MEQIQQVTNLCGLAYLFQVDLDMRFSLIDTFQDLMVFDTYCSIAQPGGLNIKHG
jgi:hypothetical protein